MVRRPPRGLQSAPRLQAHEGGARREDRHLDHDPRNRRSGDGEKSPLGSAPGSAPSGRKRQQEEQKAQKKADDDFATTLPDGIATEKHAFFVLEDDGVPAGSLWVAVRDGMSGPALFVYALEVHEAHRGKGFGRALMEFGEEEARRRGLSSIALNVFGGNEVARNLYRSLGYAESAVFMVKEL